MLFLESGGNIVEKLVKPGTNSCFVPFEEPFNVIHELHIESHSGRDIMQRHMATRFANVTTDHINIYRSFCEKCGLKKSKARKDIHIFFGKEKCHLSLRKFPTILRADLLKVRDPG